MATATKNTTEAPDFAQKIREQALSSVKQGQQVSIEAAQAWVKALSVLPITDLPKVPGFPSVSDLEAAATFTFDVAADLLQAQRDFVSQFANVLVSAKSV